MRKRVDFSLPIRITNGRPARVICMDREGDNPYHIVVLVKEKDGREVPVPCDSKGTLSSLFNGRIENIPEKKDVWINIFSNKQEHVYLSREEADFQAVSTREACVKVTYEVGEGVEP